MSPVRAVEVFRTRNRFHASPSERADVGLSGAELDGMNVKKLGSPPTPPPLPTTPPFLSYYNGSLEKRGPSFVLSTSCSAHFKPLQAPTVHHLPQCCLAQAEAAPLEVPYLFSGLSETCAAGGVEGAGCQIPLKGRAANACIACPDPPQPLCLPGSFKPLHSDPPSLRAAQRRRRGGDGRGGPIVLLHKAAERRQTFGKTVTSRRSYHLPPPCYFTSLRMTYNVHYLENASLSQLIITHFDKWMTIMSPLIYEMED